MTLVEIQDTPEGWGMQYGHYAAYFFGGAFLANAIPHYVSGVMGRPFQSPFAAPPGKGLSSASVNVLWGFFNFALAYVMLGKVSDFDLRYTDQFVTAGLGALLMSIMIARHFGQFHGGNRP